MRLVLTILEKMRINGVLKLALEEITYEDIIGTNNNQPYISETIEFLLNKACKVLETNDSPKLFNKLLKIIDLIVTSSKITNQELAPIFKDTLEILTKLYEDYERKDTILDEAFKNFNAKYIVLQAFNFLEPLNEQTFFIDTPVLETSDKQELILLKEQIKDLVKANEKLQKEKEKLKLENQKLLKDNNDLSFKETQALKESSRKEANLKHLSNLEEAVINELYSNGQSLASLKENLTSKGYTTTLSELAEVLNSLQKRLLFTPLQFLGEKAIYNLNYNPSSSLNTFKIYPVDYTVPLNLLIASDFHLDLNTKLDNCKFEELYDYCVLNNIKCILNLGDFFDTVCSSSSFTRSLSNLLDTEKLIDKVATTFPKATGIYQGILAGNHDRLFNSLALSPIEKLVEKREDFFFLGYDHALAELSPALTDNTLSLHHIRYRYEGIENSNDVQNLIRSFLKGQVDLNKITFSLLGHTHRSFAELAHNFSFIPSYTKDRFQNGAWHLKIYYNSDKTINYIIFIPLVLTDKLYRAGEFVHQSNHQRSLGKS